MRNKYLLLGAASALMLAACSEDIKGPDSNGSPAENALNLTSLSPASQAGRVSLPGETRGQKSDRLQLVAKISPVSQAAIDAWSATGIAISNGNAYVSWHSNRQAQTHARSWGGAIDVLNIGMLSGQAGAIDPAGVITGTQVTSTAKFNGIVADGRTFYLPITSYSHGAVVGRWEAGSEVIDTISIPGVSAHSVEMRGSDVYAVSGYKGGVYSFPDSYFGSEEHGAVNEVIPYSETFGGKYIDNGLVLRTDDYSMQILNLDGSVRNEGNPLISSVKLAETYNPDSKEWTLVEGTEATHYGKHTMALDGHYCYVGGGKGGDGENGLRVYSATGIAWQNGTNTTAVAVAGDYVFAATGAGLRVYEKYNGKELPLFAFEVLNYDENGKAAPGGDGNPAAGVADSKKPVAGTDAHSCNFVAYDELSGLIFMACGQSGVYVFRLDTSVAVDKKLTGFVTPNGGNTQQVDEDSDPVEITVPEGPKPDDKTFENWKDKNGNVWKPGATRPFKPGEIIDLTPVYSAIVTFKYDSKEDTEKVEVGTTVAATKFPTPATAPDGKVFAGSWVIEGTETPFDSKTTVERNITVVPVWKDKDVTTLETGFKIANGTSYVEQLEPGTSREFEVPKALATVPAGKEFDYWEGDDGKNYIPGNKETLTAGTVITLTPIYKDHAYKYTLKFDGNKPSDITVSNLPSDMNSDEPKFTIPEATPTVPKGTVNPDFVGWALDPAMTVAHRDAGLWTPINPKDVYELSAEGTVTLYAIWATTTTGGGNQGADEPKPPVGGGGGAGDSGSDTM